MKVLLTTLAVFPAEGGYNRTPADWIPAFAGMTTGEPLANTDGGNLVSPYPTHCEQGAFGPLGRDAIPK